MLGSTSDMVCWRLESRSRLRGYTLGKVSKRVSGVRRKCFEISDVLWSRTLHHDIIADAPRNACAGGPCEECSVHVGALFPGAQICSKGGCLAPH